MLSQLSPRSALARSATAATATALLALGVTGCERDDAPKPVASPVASAAAPSLHVQKLEDNIRAGIAARYGAKVEQVACPPSLNVAAGRDIQCRVHVEASKLPLEVSVTWTSDAGAFSWRDRGVVRLDKLKALVVQKLSADKRPGVAKCVGTIRVSQPGSEFECLIEYEDGGVGTVTVRVRTWQGEVDLEFR